MNSKYKTACILLDKRDLHAFENDFKDKLPEDHCWYPLDYPVMRQLMARKTDKAFYLPRITEEESCNKLTQKIYEESQRFLKQVFLANKIIEEPGDLFPLEYQWLDIWVGVYRLIMFCKDLLCQCPVDEVIIIKRDSLINHGGLLINMASFTNIISAFFLKLGVKILTLECHESRSSIPGTIFYGERPDFKSSIEHLKWFLRWKKRTYFNGNRDYMLIRPSNDNIINYQRPFYYESLKSIPQFPQVFHVAQMPFLHSWKKQLKFFIANFSFQKNHIDEIYYSDISFHSSLFNFPFDFAEEFQETIVKYLKDINWMKKYIDMFWDTCIDRCKLIIFSFSPIYLYSYFLIQKARKSGCKVAAWAHGGAFDSMSFFGMYVQVYKMVDYFLSFGECSLDEVSNYTSYKCGKAVKVGTNIIYGNPSIPKISKERPYSDKGLYFPPVVSYTFYSIPQIKWDAPMQYKGSKRIIDYFFTGIGGKLVVKGLNTQEWHLELSNYIKTSDSNWLSYFDIATDMALQENPRFIVLDCSITPLIQVLAQYKGPIFYMQNQEPLALNKDALTLLKKRVIYSSSVDELLDQLTDFFKTGYLRGTDLNNTDYVDTYIMPFNWNVYENFIMEAAKQ